jgi:hypothetical protein
MWKERVHPAEVQGRATLRPNRNQTTVLKHPLIKVGSWCMNHLLLIRANREWMEPAEVKQDRTEPHYSMSHSPLDSHLLGVMSNADQLTMLKLNNSKDRQNLRIISTNSVNQQDVPSQRGVSYRLREQFLGYRDYYRERSETVIVKIIVRQLFLLF